MPTHRADQVRRCVMIEHDTADLPVAALDATVLEELRDTLGGQTELVASLYARFLAHAALYIEALRDQGNPERVTPLHTLKGSAAMMGAIRISALASRLHEACSRSDAPPAQSAIQQLEDELTMFRHALAVHFPE